MSTSKNPDSSHTVYGAYTSANIAAVNGTANTGGGGGGAGSRTAYATFPGANGGSGIVIITW